MVETCRALSPFLPGELGARFGSSDAVGPSRDQLAHGLRTWLVMKAAKTAMSIEINALAERGRRVGGQEVRGRGQALPSGTGVSACL